VLECNGEKSFDCVFKKYKKCSKKQNHIPVCLDIKLYK